MSLSSDKNTKIHTIADVFDSEETEFAGFENYPPGAYYNIEWGGGGDITRLLGLIFEIDEQSQSTLFNALPNAMVLRKDECRGLQALKDALMSFTSEENNMEPGEYAIKNNVSEALLKSQFRAHVTQTNYSSGILGAIKDPYLQRVLVAIQKQPEAPWTLAAMAKEAGLSRTAFAERFRRILKDTPMNYLHQHRMRLALSMLRDTQWNIERIANTLGYTTARVFRNHFNRHFQMSPNQYRKTLNSE